MNKFTPTSLLAAARRASRRAIAPYSRFAVGAALVSRKGSVYMGANVESASYGLTCCAERIALFKALTDGARDFVAMAVVAPSPGGPMPCGACRQLLAEYAPHATIFAAETGRKTFRSFKVCDLLPYAFLDVPTLAKTSKRH